MFEKFIIDQPNMFKELTENVKFENITGGRKGAILVDCDSKDSIPIVRTTTVYKQPVQKFLPIYYNLIKNIGKLKGTTDLNFSEICEPEILNFNNALVEIYDHNYRTMGYHSDQALDLCENSYICLFSCYENPIENKEVLRKLKISAKAHSAQSARTSSTGEFIPKNKSSEIEDTITLDNNSIVLFSLETNRNNLHKIVLETETETIDESNDNRWLGITFRLSKTFINFENGVPYFYPIVHKVLELKMGKDEKKEYYKYRSLENKKTDFKYPDLDYTISISDTLPISTEQYNHHDLS